MTETPIAAAPDPVRPDSVRWVPPSGQAAPQQPRPPLMLAMRRGVMNRCPVCGEGHVFRSFLKLVPACESCGTRLGKLRPDDAAPYFVILIAGHVLMPPIFWIDRAYEPPVWLHMVVWLPLFAVLCTLLLRPVKGAIVGLLCRLGITGNTDDPNLYGDAPR